jgi:hypothetical protein
MVRPFSGTNVGTNGTDDTNDFQIEIVPADGTNAAFNWRDYGRPRWQLSVKITPISNARERGMAAGIGPSRRFHNSAHVRCWSNRT